MSWLLAMACDGCGERLDAVGIIGRRTSDAAHDCRDEADARGWTRDDRHCQESWFCPTCELAHQQERYRVPTLVPRETP